MQRVYVKDIRDNLEKCILVQGFVENFRDGKAMCFIVLKDITGRVQITIEKDEHPDLLPALGQITPDSVISVIGVAHESEYVKMGGIEIFPTEIKVESIAAALPIQREDIPATKKKAAVARSGIDDRMDYRWIDLRTARNQLIFKAQTLFTKAMRDFLYERGFLEIHTPKLIGAASESGSEVFEVKYFDRNAYLAQSPQFYKQMAMASGFDRIFEVGPVFRAEKSYTNKHTTEFTGFDVEFSYITSYRDVMKMEEELLTYALAKVKDELGNQIKEIFGIEVVVPATPLSPCLNYTTIWKRISATRFPTQKRAI